ncbi:hypothetical protein G6Z94_11835 [Vibrio aestuarianus]|uniref:hypothetical protein n=1 Tax=Vibrio aestuarianus TaxID=28171 RepID=UPI001594E1CA|nr:hypothetical protein [Vibrio aestuarianus]NGZ18030.1 hypothetical protein [Vibrio aestuarianus]
MDSMRSLINTGDYSEALKALIEKEVSNNARVLYAGEVDPQNKTKPFIFLTMPEVLEFDWSGDGRHEAKLSVSILIKVPKNVDNAPIEALNVSGFVHSLILGQVFGDYFNIEDDHFDHPEEIGGQPIEWDTNEQGYEVTFTQVIRYGTVEKAAFVLKAIDIKETFGEPKRIYEHEGDS